MKEIPKIPKEYLGKAQSKGGGNITQPRRWTKKEEEWLKKMLENGYSKSEIALSLNRSETSISIKAKRLTKLDNTYNKPHIKQKYELNYNFLEKIKPTTILDLYCGINSYYKNYNVTTNDINKSINADYNEDAFKLLCKLYYENKKYDLIDLDPYGSAYDCFDLAIKMAKKGLIITLGELGHKRWKRLDYVMYHYGINKLEDFTIDNLIKYIQQIGLRNKKELIVYKKKEWRNIGRVYFIIKKIKVTSQWKPKETKDLQMTIDDYL